MATDRILASGFLGMLSYMAYSLVYDIVEARRYIGSHSDKSSENRALEYSKRSGNCCNCCRCCEKKEYPKRDKDPSVEK